MQHSTKKPTKDEAARMARLKELGCVACIQGLKTQRLVALTGWEVHHLLSGNKRRGHMFTIPLCTWHHRGESGWTKKAAEELLGPSLALRSKKFHEVYGSDNELLALTNELLEKNHACGN